MKLKCQFFIQDFIYLFAFIKLEMLFGTKMAIEIKHPCMFIKILHF